MLDISDIVQNYGWGFEADAIRIDPGDYAGKTFEIRSIHVNDGNFIPAEYLTLDSTGAHAQSLTRDNEPDPSDFYIANGPDLAYKQWYVNTNYDNPETTSDPIVLTNPLEKNLSDQAILFHIIYKSSIDISPLEISFLQPESASRKKTIELLPASPNTWKHVIYNIETERTDYGWGYAGDALRLDFGDIGGAEIEIQTLMINYEEVITGTPEIPVESFSVSGSAGGIIIKSPEKQTFVIYNLMGAQIRKLTLEGENFVPLERGLYIVNGKKVISK